MKTRTATHLLFLLVFLIAFLFQACQEEDVITPMEEPNRNMWPTIDFISPSHNSYLLEDSIVLIELDAYDEDGVISKVDIIIDDSLVKSITEIPFKFSWVLSRADLGSHKIKARAFDDFGKRSTKQISVTVGYQLYKNDYRKPYLGNFRFNIVSHENLGGPYGGSNTYRYNLDGVIRDYIPTDDCCIPYENEDSIITLDIPEWPGRGRTLTAILKSNGDIYPLGDNPKTNSNTFITTDSLIYATYINHAGGWGKEEWITAIRSN